MAKSQEASCVYLEQIKKDQADFFFVVIKLEARGKKPEYILILIKVLKSH